MKKEKITDKKHGQTEEKAKARNRTGVSIKFSIGHGCAELNAPLGVFSGGVLQDIVTIVQTA